MGRFSPVRYKGNFTSGGWHPIFMLHELCRLYFTAIIILIDPLSPFNHCENFKNLPLYSFRSPKSHRKTKSEPPIKTAFVSKPLIEFCLQGKVYDFLGLFRSRSLINAIRIRRRIFLLHRE